MKLRDAASKKILVEVALLKAIEARGAVSMDSLLKQLQDLRDGKAGEGTGTPVRAAAPAPKPARAGGCRSVAGPCPARCRYCHRCGCRAASGPSVAGPPG